MSKRIIAISVAALSTLILLGCAAKPSEQEASMHETENTNDADSSKIIIILEENTSDNSENIILEGEEISNEIVEQEIAETTVNTPVIPQIDISSGNQQSVTNSTNTSSTPIAAVSNPTPVTEPKPAPQVPTPEPAPNPQPPPEQLPTPELPPPQPPPVIVEPPLAITICNICEADITGNIAAHGTIYLLNNENFSYRVE